MTQDNSSIHKKQILFIAGYGRSGSTLMERLLSQVAGITATGEICHIWRRGFGENQLCGCESSFASCPFWSGVAGYFSAKGQDPEAALASGRRVTRLRNLLQILYPALRSSRFRRDFACYQESLRILYDAIADRNDGNVIVDSSKDPMHGLILATLPNVDLRVLHLVRDSRGVAFSWMRKKIRPEIQKSEAFMPVFSRTRSSLVWNLKNSLSEILKKRAGSYLRIRYEDLVSFPSETIERVIRGLGLNVPSINTEFIAGHSAHLDVDHTCAGNPLRFRRGELTIKLDAAWRDEMNARDRRYVTMLTYPWLRMYGYLK